MLQKLCILLLGYLGYRLWKRLTQVEEQVVDNTIDISKLKERASE